MKAFLALLVLCVGGFAPVQSPAPVTGREARAAFQRATKLITQTLGLSTATPTFKGSSNVASREQIVASLAELYRVIEPKIVVTPPPTRFDPAVITLKNQARIDAETLIKLGFVDRVGPLVAGKSPGLTPREFGDALGYFLARVADVTHTPSSKYSPALMHSGGG